MKETFIMELKEYGSNGLASINTTIRPTSPAFTGPENSTHKGNALIYAVLIHAIVHRNTYNLSQFRRPTLPVRINWNRVAAMD